MPDGIEFDLTELTRLAADLGDAPDAVKKNLPKALSVIARNIKDDWKRNAEGGRIRRSAVTYDINAKRDSVEAEIGPEVGRTGVQGAIVGALEYGFGGRQGPRGYGAAALQRNEADFITGVAKAVADGEREVGL